VARISGKVSEDKWGNERRGMKDDARSANQSLSFSVGVRYLEVANCTQKQKERAVQHKSTKKQKRFRVEADNICREIMPTSEQRL
jgi:hypothetical protein